MRKTERKSALFVASLRDILFSFSKSPKTPVPKEKQTRKNKEKKAKDEHLLPKNAIGCAGKGGNDRNKPNFYES